MENRLKPVVLDCLGTGFFLKTQFFVLDDFYVAIAGNDVADFNGDGVAFLEDGFHVGGNRHQ